MCEDLSRLPALQALLRCIGAAELIFLLCIPQACSAASCRALPAHQSAWRPGRSACSAAVAGLMCAALMSGAPAQELFSAQELQEKFSLERITKSAAVFDKTKLSWMNGQYLRALPDEEVGPSQRVLSPLFTSARRLAPC